MTVLAVPSFLAVTAAGAGPKQEGLPQFNPEFFTSQLFWLAVTFAALYMFLSKVALPRIGQVVEARRNRIQRDLEEAQRMKTETDAALKSYEEALASARGKAQGIAKETRERISAEVDRERQRVDAEIATKVAETEKSIAANKTRALASVGDIATETAGAIVGRLLGEDVSVSDIKAAVAAAARS
ncbi:MAG: F0F1 ATP synthase subunit B [Hyphomicrobiaceae bacterium]